MRSLQAIDPPPAAPGCERLRPRSALARSRAAEAHAMLSRCRFCAHLCGANRQAGETGPCRATTAPHVFGAQIETGDELDLIPAFEVSFSGCDLRCDFCISGAPSWNPRAGEPLDLSRVAATAQHALAGGARTVMFLGGEPTVQLPWALELAALLPEEATLVWKTNAHGSAEGRALLDGIFDVWLADLKFGNDDCARRIAGVENYSGPVQETLVWASGHSRLLVRHLLLPGHEECCFRPLVGWLAGAIPGARLSLHAGFWPAWHSGRHPELGRTIAPEEAQAARALAAEAGLTMVD